jgi:hypothetical protein
MESIYRFIVKHLGEEETIKVNGKILFINCPFKKSLKAFSFPTWKFSKKKYAKKLEQYNITCIDWLEYSVQNILYYLLLDNLEKYDCFCFEFAGFEPSTLIKTKQFLLELKPHLDNKIILIVVEKHAIEDNDVFSEFPVYN